ncbi:hypothetical protein FQA47_004809 [Oryzias melastigma]|uniref:Uncharacterized protein n=1 Tax=Oryzias melastigma TaxID=30732 RepID=A0A834BRA6_ORYME|nr:hypothetical protein FQA47_004809 [Oryzias melastigma]
MERRKRPERRKRHPETGAVRSTGVPGQRNLRSAEGGVDCRADDSGTPVPVRAALQLQRCTGSDDSGAAAAVSSPSLDGAPVIRLTPASDPRQLPDSLRCSTAAAGPARVCCRAP